MLGLLSLPVALSQGTAARADANTAVAKLADLELHLEKGLLVEAGQVQQNAYAGGAA